MKLEVCEFAGENQGLKPLGGVLLGPRERTSTDIETSSSREPEFD